MNSNHTGTYNDFHHQTQTQTQTQTHSLNDELKLWLQNKRPAVYESGVLHGYSCLCCSKIPKDGIVRKSKLGRRPGGHNKK
jgi:hypothetical protein